MKKATRARRALALAVTFVTAAGALAAFTAPASAGGYTDTSSTLDAGTLSGSGAQSGTFSNGVGWSVDQGVAHPAQGYVVQLSAGLQTWSFTEPVVVDYAIAGLNCPGEGAQLAEGTVAVDVNPEHTWNAGTRVVSGGNGAPIDAVSYFSSDVPVTEVTVNPVGASGCGRGIRFIKVTAFENAAPTATITTPANQTTYFQGETGAVVDYSCDDADSDDVASLQCEGSLADGATIDTSEVGVKTLTVTATDQHGATGTATAQYRVIPVINSCKGIALGLPLTINIGVGNPLEYPCINHTGSLLNYTQTIGLPMGPLALLNSTVTAKALVSHGKRTADTVGADSLLAEVGIKVPALGIDINAKNLWSEVSAQLQPGCGGLTKMKGSSSLSNLTINGKTYVIGSDPISIPLVVGELHVNYHRESTYGVAQAALFLDLPGELLDVKVAHSRASAVCNFAAVPWP